MTLSDVLSFVATLSEEDAKSVRGAADARARDLAMKREDAVRRETWATWKMVRLGTGVRYRNDSPREANIAKRLGFMGDADFVLRQRHNGRAWDRRGIWVAKAWDAPVSEWRFVNVYSLVTGRWSVVEEGVQS